MSKNIIPREFFKYGEPTASNFVRAFDWRGSHTFSSKIAFTSKNINQFAFAGLHMERLHQGLINGQSILALVSLNGGAGLMMTL